MNVLLEVEVREAVPHRTDDGVPVLSEQQVSLAIHCSVQVRKLYDARSIELITIISS